MPNKIRKIKFEKLMSEIEFLQKDLEYHELLFEEKQAEFSKKFEEKIGSGDKVEKAAPKIQEAGEEIVNATKSKASKRSQEVFKKIAIKTHPDKLINLPRDQSEILKSDFLSASRALEEDNLAQLYVIAKKLGIEIPDISDEDLRIIQKNVDATRQKIENICGSWVWKYGGAGPLVRDIIMDAYIEHLLKEE
jgi:hypothetical protein